MASEAAIEKFSELPDELNTERARLVSYITKKSSSIEKLTYDLGPAVRREKENVRKYFGKIGYWLAQMESHLMRRLEELEKSRRTKLTKATHELNKLHPKLSSIGMQEFFDAVSIEEEFKSIREASDDIFDDVVDPPAYLAVNVRPTEKVRKLLSELFDSPIRLLWNLETAPIQCAGYALEVAVLGGAQDADDGGTKIKITVRAESEETGSESPSVAPTSISKVTLSETTAVLKDVKGAVLAKAVLIDLHKIGQLEIVEKNTLVFNMEIPSASNAMDIMVGVDIAGVDIANSPSMLSVRKNQSFFGDAGGSKQQLPDFLYDRLKMARPDEARVTGDTVGSSASTSTSTLTEDAAAKDTAAWRTLNPDEPPPSRGTNETRMDQSDMRAAGPCGVSMLPTVPEDAIDPADQYFVPSGAEEQRDRVLYHPLPAAIAARDSPVGSPVGSPRLSTRAHLPLDQPSPLNSRSNNVPTGTPGMSTGRMDANWRAFAPQLDADGVLVDSPTPSLEPTCGIEANLHNFQKNLSGEGGDGAAAAQQSMLLNNTNGRRNVSFSAHTTIFTEQRGACDDDIGNNAGGGYGDLTCDPDRLNLNRSSSQNRDLTMCELMAAADREQKSRNVSVRDIIQRDAAASSCEGCNHPECHDVTEVVVQTTTGETKLVDGDQRLSKNLLQKQRQQQEQDVFWADAGDSGNGSANQSMLSDAGSLNESLMNRSTVPLSSLNIVKQRRMKAQELARELDEYPSIWDKSNESYERYKAMREKEFQAERTEQILSWSDWSTSGSPKAATDKRKSKREGKDLSQPTMTLAHFVSHDVGGMPQTVSRRSGLDGATFVTDVSNNRVHVIRGISSNKISLGGQVNFFRPRSVLYCEPEEKVLVLDDRALYVFSAKDGSLLDNMFDKEAHRFRGLAYYERDGRVVTTESTETNILIRFIDINFNKACMMEIPLFGESEMKPAGSRVCFVAVNGDYVYTTDMGAGLFYRTWIKHLSTEVKTHVESGTNWLKSATGVAFDGEDNTLVCSMAHRRIQVFGPAGDYKRSIDLKHTESPSGLAVDGNQLFVSDAKRRKVDVYNICEM